MIGKTPAKPRRNSAFQHLMSIHWWMANFYFVLFATGSFMTRLPDELLIRNPLYAFHKLLGTFVLALLTWRIVVLLRVWWRKYSKKFPKFTAQWFRVVALHTTLYVFMFVVPVSGMFLTNTYNSLKDKSVDGTLSNALPQELQTLELARSLHFWLAYIFLAFIILHLIDQWNVVKALWRRFTQTIKKLQHSFSK